MPFAAATPRRSCRATPPHSAAPFAVPRRPGERRGTRTTGSGQLNGRTWSAPAHGAAFGHGSPQDPRRAASRPRHSFRRFPSSPATSIEKPKSICPSGAMSIHGAQPRLGNIRTRPAVRQEGATTGASNARWPTLRCISGFPVASDLREPLRLLPWLRTSPGHGGPCFSTKSKARYVRFANAPGKTAANRMANGIAEVAGESPTTVSTLQLARLPRRSGFKNRGTKIRLLSGSQYPLHLSAKSPFVRQ